MSVSSNLNNMVEDFLKLKSVVWLPVCFGAGLFGGYRFGYDEGFQKGYDKGKKEMESEISEVKKNHSSLDHDYRNFKAMVEKKLNFN